MNRNRLYKSNTDYVFLGVCGGISEALLIPSILERLVFLFFPVSLLVYLVLGALMGTDDFYYDENVRKKSRFKTLILAFVFAVIVIVILSNLEVI
ncbi:PspC domain-containing protein [Gottfriedia acidiceleris]|uniref:PspC domain-containing protein n=1 Tax=Gottfriedia acidiceleris TaxID=371036 RepID=UPI002FFDB4A9